MLLWGGGAILFIIVLMAGLRIYQQRQFFMDSIRHIETKIFGKPLEKQYWGKGEWKNTKIKVVLRK